MENRLLVCIGMHFSAFKNICNTRINLRRYCNIFFQRFIQPWFLRDSTPPFIRYDEHTQVYGRLTENLSKNRLLKLWQEYDNHVFIIALKYGKWCVQLCVQEFFNISLKRPSKDIAGINSVNHLLFQIHEVLLLGIFTGLENTQFVDKFVKWC